MNLAETCHFVHLVPPQSDTTGLSSSCFSMENWSHATIICLMGATNADAGFITVQKCTSSAAAGATDFAFQYYAEETDAGDVLDAAPTRVTAATGIDAAPSGVNNIMYIIELDAAELGPTYQWVRVTFSVPGAANLIAAVAILSGGRDARPASPTVLS